VPRASARTLLSLDRYARILGLDPLHFAGGYSTVRPTPTCSDVWFQWDWQNPDLVSREQVSRLIEEAEQDIADALGYWPAPTWIVGESHPFTKPSDRSVIGTGYNVQSRRKSIRANWGHVLYGGQRATQALNAGDPVAAVFADTDGDGFNEWAVFTILNVPSTLDVCEVRAYFLEYDALAPTDCRTDPSSVGPDPAWEVRPLKATLVGTTLTVYVKSWDLFRPQLHEALNAASIDADDPLNYVDTLLFYREYNDPSTQVQFLWGEDVICSDPACAWAMQTGCLRVKNPRNGIVVPQPGTYDAVTGTFSQDTWAQSHEPDAVRLWYKAGYLPDRTYGCTELDPFWAKTITMLATARLDWPLCTCSNVELLVDTWRENVSLMTPNKSFNITMNDLVNPFGIRLGEVLAWKRIVKGNRQLGRAILT